MCSTFIYAINMLTSNILKISFPFSIHHFSISKGIFFVILVISRQRMEAVVLSNVCRHYRRIPISDSYVNQHCKWICLYAKLKSQQKMGNKSWIFLSYLQNCIGSLRLYLSEQSAVSWPFKGGKMYICGNVPLCLCSRFRPLLPQVN